MLTKDLVAKIKKHQVAIAKHRDALRDIAADVESVVDSADRAIYNLELAILDLSEYL